MVYIIGRLFEWNAIQQRGGEVREEVAIKNHNLCLCQVSSVKGMDGSSAIRTIKRGAAEQVQKIIHLGRPCGALHYDVDMDTTHIIIIITITITIIITR